MDDPMSEGGLRADVQQLTGTLKGFEKSVTKLAGDQARTIRRLRRRTWLLAASVALDIVLTVAIAVNASRINDIQSRISNEVLCPLYTIFLKSYHPELQKPDKLAEYEANFAEIRDGYRKLGCTVTDTVTPTLKPSARSS